jgi:putative ATP-binding cassette transporter
VPILTLFGRELRGGRWRWFLALAAVSGIAGAAVLAVINLAAAGLTDPDARARFLIVLILAILIYIYAQRTLMIMAAELAQGTVHGLRTGMLQRLEAAELAEVEQLSRNEIFSCIDSEMRAISDGASTVMIIAQSAVLSLVTMIYLAWLSPLAFVLATAVIGIAAMVHLTRGREIAEQLERLFRLNTEMMAGFSDLLDGFKEIKLNSAGAEELADLLRRRSSMLSSRSLVMHTTFATSFVAAQVAFFLLTASMVFVVPMFVPIEPATLVKITATTLFVIGPISNVVSGLPTIQRLNGAANSVLSLQNRLSQIQLWSPAAAPAIGTFERITLADVAFRYDNTEGTEGFTVGPVNLEIPRGQLIFITGGNGSGKSTLLKLITGLYLTNSGAVMVDGRRIERNDIIPYRNLFWAIFSDYHLFGEIYGIPQPDPARAAEYVQLMELDGKVTIIGRTFSTVALSSGQRKRLAMIAALLADRQVYIFDEWAADQDPHFRQKFYEVILPRLKSAGKTVIAVTHDERYFAAADVRYHMEEGRFRLVSSTE